MNISDPKPNHIPPPLQEISDPPKKLYIKGTLPSFETNIYLTVIGSRRFTPYGKLACEKLVSGLRGYPIVIVSGLAHGMDTLAHQAALENNLVTVAFPGSGLDEKVLYPAANRGLTEHILEAGGALVSEFEPDQKSGIWCFPRRNRLMAGISHATLVIEATNKSGSRITASLATQYNRDVLAVPGDIFSQASEGTNTLIREGATPIMNSEQILQELGFNITDTPPADLFADCNENEKLVIEKLGSPIPRGELLRNLNMSTSDANVLLSAMEIRGLIKEEMGMMQRAR